MSKVKLKFEKLVRDKAPQGFAADGIKLKYEKIKGKKLENSLKDKLLEEVEELLKSESQTQLIEEIADIHEVLHAICKINNISKEIIHKTRQDKRVKRGGFESGIFAHYIESEDNNPALQHFLNSFNKYSIIK